MSNYIGDEATLVYGPIGRRKDGEWSRREVILAAFRDKAEARYYAEVKRAAGMPARTDGRTAP